MQNVKTDKSGRICYYSLFRESIEVADEIFVVGDRSSFGWTQCGEDATALRRIVQFDSSSFPSRRCRFRRALKVSTCAQIPVDSL